MPYRLLFLPGVLILSVGLQIGDVSAVAVALSGQAMATESAPQPRRAPTGTALNACRDLTRPGKYYLAKDVSSAGVCFGIDANHIMLNLNGHAIVYGTGGGSKPTPAIEGHGCWSTTSPGYGGPCGSAHGGLEVYGGTIVQSSKAAAFSPVFGFGQGTFSSAPYIHDIKATFQNTGAQFYYSNYIVSGARIENNVIYDNVTNIQHPGQGIQSARSAFQGQAILIAQNNQNPGAGDQIIGNTIVGSPQGGIRTVNQYSIISGNDISMNATYANDFCADIPGDHAIVAKNNCHPKSGRGFHTDASYVTISDNIINVVELKQDTEYNGCEGGGAYGIQVEFNNSFLPAPPVGVIVRGNKITATAKECKAIGLRVTDMTPTGSATFTENSITTTNTGAASDFGISMDGTNNAGVNFEGNTFRDQYAYAEGDWDGYRATIGHNVWEGRPAYTFAANDGACDPTQKGDGAVCPSSATFVDHLPNKVRCGAWSAASITIGGQRTKCKSNH